MVSMALPLTVLLLAANLSFDNLELIGLYVIMPHKTDPLLASDYMRSLRVMFYILKCGDPQLSCILSW